MEDDSVKITDIQLRKIPRKIEEAQEWMVTAGSEISSNNHKIRESREDIEKILKDIGDIKADLQHLHISISELEVKMENLKCSVDKVVENFTWAKIITVGLSIITIGGGAIGVAFTILKNTGIIK